LCTETCAKYIIMSQKVKIMLNPKHTLKDGYKAVVLRLTVQRKRTYISLGLKTLPENWNLKTARFKKNHSPLTYKEDNFKIDFYIQKANEALLNIERKEIPLNASNFKKYFSNKAKVQNIFEFFDEIIEELQKKGKLGSAKNYRSCRNALARFHKKNTLTYREIDINFMNKFEVFLFATCSGNGIASYMKEFKSLFNKAIARERCKIEDSPFKSLYNPNGYSYNKLLKPTRKRAISVDDLKKIINFHTEPDTILRNNQNYFLFSFYNVGMNFTDIVHLKWENINNGRIMYQRKKTGKRFSIKILPQVQKILDYYQERKFDSEYIFPILSEKHNTEELRQRRSKYALETLNKKIKIIGNLANVPNSEMITSYVARHTWASYMKSLGKSHAEIGRGFQHSSEKITDIYITELVDTTTDSMNEALLDL